MINIVGGLAIGLVRHGMRFADAAATFTTLTVGDGLVSQIPALLVSTAAGIVVTKGGMEGTADAALVRQLGGSPKPLAHGRRRGGGARAACPACPCCRSSALAGLAGGGGVAALQAPARIRRAARSRRHCRFPTEPPISDTLRIDMIRLELGYGLLVLAGGDAPRLTEQIKGLRRSIAAEMGFVLPAGAHPGQHAAPGRHLRRSASRRSKRRGASCAHEAAGHGPQGGAPTWPASAPRTGLRPARALDRDPR